MGTLYTILDDLQDELDKIIKRLERNADAFKKLEEGQALTASQVIYLIGSPSAGGTGGSTAP
jgi:outer membrane protein assembly factor BamE (lipoprotein component of BamABCDE complex)